MAELSRKHWGTVRRALVKFSRRDGPLAMSRPRLDRGGVLYPRFHTCHDYSCGCRPLEGRGPVLFRQVRIDKSGATFTQYKTRKMSVDGDRILADHLASDPAAAAEWDLDYKLKIYTKVTPLGLALRKSVLDKFL